MSSSTRSDLAPFAFPDPSVQDRVVNPITGDTWIFQDGVWMISDPGDPDGEIPAGEPLSESEEINLLRVEIANLRAELARVRDISNDIIDLKAQISAASVNNFLVLE